MQLFRGKTIGQEVKNIVHSIKKLCVFNIIILILLSIFGCGVESGGNGNDGTKSTTSDDNGSVTLSWKEPTSDANGSSLHDLAGYKIYYGISSRRYTRSVDVGHFTSMVISNLSPGNWCFAITAYDVSGNESEYSNEMCKTI